MDLSWVKRGVAARRRDGVPDAGRARGGVEWVRAAAAPPSIPAPSQSFGYEENELGELVLQRPSKPQQQAGNLAPGSYLSATHEHPFAFERKRGFVEWSKSRTHRDMNVPVKVPATAGAGPDNEEIPGATRGGGRGSRPLPKKSSAFFASKSERLNGQHLGLTRKDPIPGPGQSHRPPINALKKKRANAAQLPSPRIV